jgi:hypothetical protein
VPTDGSTITWKLGKLGQSQLIDVALVPTDQSVFQANFNKPDAKSLEVTPGASADTGGGGTGSAVLGTGSQPDSLAYATADPGLVPDVAPYLDQPAVNQAIGQAPAINYPQGNAIAPVAAQREAKDTLQTFAEFGLIALAALFSRFRGQAHREPRSLVNFGKNREADVS